MNFLALLLGLGLERALTHFLHLRAFEWLDPVFDATFRRLGRRHSAAAASGLAAVALLLVAPVLYASVLLAGESSPFGFFVFSIVVLLFSLGPRDLQEEVHEYCAAVETGTAADVQRLATELTERQIAGDAAAVAGEVERAIYIQANNRIFGVVFWFLVLGPAGPAGAWLFRVSDLMRRRAVTTAVPGFTLAAACRLHGVLAWLPARLMAAGFALSGSFEGALAAWRARGGAGAQTFFRETDELIGRVGRGARDAMQPGAHDGSAPAQSGRSALALVRRTLWLIWYPLIALLTLNNWLH